AVTRVCDSQAFVLGPEVVQFEQKIAEFTGSPHALGVSSGTDAETLILMAIGLQPGDAVITTPFTFFATAGSISRLGARPLFVDIDAATYNLSPTKLREFLARECKRTSEGVFWSGIRVRGIVPVHLFGLCCEMDPILEIALESNLPVIEDAAQAIGAIYPSTNGLLQAGAISEHGYFSFYPTKNLGGFGEAGMVLTKSESTAARMRSLRNHGMEPRYYHSEIGGNFRLDALQAAVLACKLPYLENWSRRRWQIAQRYREGLRHLEPELRLPVEPYCDRVSSRGHIYHQFVVRTCRRDALKTALSESGIGTEIYYPLALHEQPCYGGLGYGPEDLPEASRAAREVLALPIFPELIDSEVDIVTAAVKEFFES
ncbi:MAG: DegT/DnrJ/EryC1/StrS family aminotransferase, partial [Verrucomicrobia bacterium]|nr:DegT/DnrJ/EryC1/StrS family aminotransferase [Verrucomicrobiota bacterium]